MTFAADVQAGRLGCMVLGSVQLGLKYGIANRQGKPSRRQAHDVLTTAWQAGVRVLDTAQAYGDSEDVIGEHLRIHPQHDFHVISKIAPRLDHRDRKAVYDAAMASHRCMSKPLASLMLHDASALSLWDQGLGSSLRRCVDEGIAETLGVSVYTPDEFRAALDIREIAVIQAPLNALDRRLVDADLVRRATDSGRIVVLRSVFLQGLLLLDQESIPPHMEFCRQDLLRWQAICDSFGFSRAKAAIQYVHCITPGSLIVVGCERPDQVLANVSLLEENAVPEALLTALSAMPPPVDRVVNPSLWPKT